MKRYILFSTFVLFLVVACQNTEAYQNTGASKSTGAVSQNIWVSSTSAKLKAQNQSSSETISELPFGSQLKVITYEKRWYNVSTPEKKTGWVYRGWVSSEPPEQEEESDEEDSLGSLLGDSSESSIQADSADSSRSIRGLSPEAEEYAKQSGSPKRCKKALDSVLSMKTKNKDIDKFLKKGKIGEYAE